MGYKRAGKYDNGAVIMINPGTGPVQSDVGPNVEQALFNMRQLCADTGSALVEPTEPPAEDGGRYTFTIVNSRNYEVEIEMPGIPLDEVRYMGEPDQNIWDYPRLYVAGSSWVWKYAISSVDYEGSPEHLEQVAKYA